MPKAFWVSTASVGGSGDPEQEGIFSLVLASATTVTGTRDPLHLWIGLSRDLLIAADLVG